MIYPVEDIKKAYYAALNGNISYAGVNIPVYSIAPKSTDPPYIILGTTSLIEVGTKSDFLYDVTLFIEVVTTDQSKAEMLSITNQILTILKPTTGSVLDLENYTMVNLILDGIEDSVQLTDTKEFESITNTIRLTQLIDE